MRFQLQGELKHKAAYDVKYRNVFSSLYKIGDVEGVRSLQKGLVPAIAYQIIYNWFRSIIYIKADERGTMRDANDNPVLWKRAAMATFGGVVGCVAASPFYMAKIQLQSRAGQSFYFESDYRVMDSKKSVCQMKSYITILFKFII